MSATFKFWCPKVHAHFTKRLKSLFETFPDLKKIFPRSIFPCCAFNLGPCVCAYKHRDHLNCPFGMCAIQPLGDYDYTRGGHIILWELGLIIEFPPYYLLLIPSALITHSNTPTAKGETRVSIAHWCPGALLRYIDNHFQTEEKFRTKDPEGFAEMQQKKATRWEEGLELFSKFDKP